MASPLPSSHAASTAPPRENAAGSGRPARAGFTLVEVIVALAIMVMIAATVMPSVVGTIDRERQDRAEEIIRALLDAVDDFHTTGHVGQYPRFLSQLTTPIVSTDRNSCNQVYGPTRAGLWKGPYLDRTVATTGLPVFIGTAENMLVRTPATGNPATLTLRITGVLLADAEAMDLRFDGALSGTTGVIRYGTVTNGTVTLEHTQAISNC